MCIPSIQQLNKLWAEALSLSPCSLCSYFGRKPCWGLSVCRSLWWLDVVCLLLFVFQPVSVSLHLHQQARFTISSHRVEVLCVWACLQLTAALTCKHTAAAYKCLEATLGQCISLHSVSSWAVHEQSSARDGGARGMWSHVLDGAGWAQGEAVLLGRWGCPLQTYSLCTTTKISAISHSLHCQCFSQCLT